MSITVIGLDIAKSAFQLHGVDAGGKVQLKRKLGVYRDAIAYQVSVNQLERILNQLVDG